MEMDAVKAWTLVERLLERNQALKSELGPLLALTSLFKSK